MEFELVFIEILIKTESMSIKMVTFPFPPTWPIPH